MSLENLSVNELILVIVIVFSKTLCLFELLRSSKIVLVIGHEDGVVRTYELPSIGSHLSCPKVVSAVELNFIVTTVCRSIVYFSKEYYCFSSAVNEECNFVY